MQLVMHALDNLDFCIDYLFWRGRNEFTSPHRKMFCVFQRGNEMLLLRNGSVATSIQTNCLVVYSKQHSRVVMDSTDHKIKFNFYVRALL